MMSSKENKNKASLSNSGAKKTKADGKTLILKVFKGSKDRSPSSTLKQTSKGSTNEVMSGGALDDEPHPQLLAKLGLLYGEQRVSHVKTTTYPHPVLTHKEESRPPTIIEDKSMKNKRKELRIGGATTSPASTLSDKGIGSSVGSFDTEFRNSHSIYSSSNPNGPNHNNVTMNPAVYDMIGPQKTGSLDSRAQEYSSSSHHDLTSSVNHTRSSSDILCNRSSNLSVHRPTLAEQSQTPLWNYDPRRGTTVQHNEMDSLIRPRWGNGNRHISRMEGIDTINRANSNIHDVKKLPQLCLDSPISENVNSISDIRSGNITLNVSRNEKKPSYYHQLSNKPKEQHFEKSLHTTNPQDHINHDTLNSSNKTNQKYRNNIENDHFYTKQRSLYDPVPYNHQIQHQPNLSYSNTISYPDTMLHPNVQNISGSNIWENSRPHSMSVPFMPLTNEEITYSNIEARSASPSINGDETISRRGLNNRSSTRSNPGERRLLSNDIQKVQRLLPERQTELNLQPLTFDIPLAVTSEPKFVGREWLYEEILHSFSRVENLNSHLKGVVVLGGSGHGKTSLIFHLVSHSYHGNRTNQADPFNETGSTTTLCSLGITNTSSRSTSGRTVPSLPVHMMPSSRNSSAQSSRTGSPVANGSISSSRTGSLVSLGEDSNCRKLASQVVAYHFCQSSVNLTCYLPEFIINIAAQLIRAPQLTAYRELLVENRKLLNLLSIRYCTVNPSLAFHKGIIEPLVQLKREQKLPKSFLIIAIDSLDESLLHKPDFGYSIFSFIEEQIGILPDFIKIIATARTREFGRISQLPFERYSLDLSSENESNQNYRTTNDKRLCQDIENYIQYRVNMAPSITSRTRSAPEQYIETELINYLTTCSAGNFLYLRMTLDLMEKGQIVPKSISFKVVPRSLDEIFTLVFNQRFVSTQTYEEVKDILAVALAGLYPLTDKQIYEAVQFVTHTEQTLSWVDFKSSLEQQLNHILVQTSPQSGRTFFHDHMREWLAGQTMLYGNQDLPHELAQIKGHKFIVDVKRGHHLLAKLLASENKDSSKTLELAHHVLKADMFRMRARESGISASENNALFLKNASEKITEAFVSARNLCYPSIKVNKLLLRAGANVNNQTNLFNKATPLAVICHTGNIELAKLLLMFAANVDSPSESGLSPLCYASIAGRQEIVELLLQYRPNLNQADFHGHTALLHAISRGHINIAHILLHCQLYRDENERNIATQRALVAASMTGHLQLIHFVLTSEVLYCDVNAVDSLNGESALTAAAYCGKTEACDILVTRYKALVNIRNKAGLTPLLKAVEHGEWATADLLLNLNAQIEESDPRGITPLIMAAKQGHLGLLEVLLNRGANIMTVDREGMTALSWAALHGKTPCVKSLIEHKADVQHCDSRKRTSLCLASFSGNTEVVKLLLRNGADIGHQDANGMAPLDRAIGEEHSEVVETLLSHGASIRTISWAMASGKEEVTTQLLSKSLEDGNTFYKASNFKSASDVYVRALKHAGEPAVPTKLSSQKNGKAPNGKLADICAHLLLGYSRCQRKNGDLNGSEVSASRALQLKPQWDEALYARARVLREKGNLKDALTDSVDAERCASDHNLREIQKLSERIRDEIRNNKK